MQLEGPKQDCTALDLKVWLPPVTSDKEPTDSARNGILQEQDEQRAVTGLYGWSQAISTSSLERTLTRQLWKRVAEQPFQAVCECSGPLRATAAYLCLLQLVLERYSVQRMLWCSHGSLHRDPRHARSCIGLLLTHMLKGLLLHND